MKQFSLRPPSLPHIHTHTNLSLMHVKRYVSGLYTELSSPLSPIFNCSASQHIFTLVESTNSSTLGNFQGINEGSFATPGSFISLMSIQRFAFKYAPFNAFLH